MMLETYWLYHGKRILTAVRLPKGSTDHTIIQKALNEHETCPGCFGRRLEAPFEFRNCLHRATVRTY